MRTTPALVPASVRRRAAFHLWLAHALKGSVQPLPADAVAKLLATRRELGLGGVNTLENRCGT